MSTSPHNNMSLTERLERLFGPASNGCWPCPVCAGGLNSASKPVALSDEAWRCEECNADETVIGAALGGLELDAATESTDRLLRTLGIGLHDEDGVVVDSGIWRVEFSGGVAYVRVAMGNRSVEWAMSKQQCARGAYEAHLAELGVACKADKNERARAWRALAGLALRLPEARLAAEIQTTSARAKGSRRSSSKGSASSKPRPGAEVLPSGVIWYPGRADLGEEGVIEAGLYRFENGGTLRPLLGGEIRVLEVVAPAGESSSRAGVRMRMQITCGGQTITHAFTREDCEDGSALDPYGALGIATPGKRGRGDLWPILQEVAARQEELQLGEVRRRMLQTPRWIDGSLDYPDPAVASASILSGYGQLAAGASGEDWAEVCRILADDLTGHGALYVGGALGGVFLERLGELALEDALDPLGFVVHAPGEGRQGKTTMQRVGAGALGNPANAPVGMVWSWGGTSLGLTQTLAAAGVFPVFLSDTSTWRHKSADLGRTIFLALEGCRPVSDRNGGVVARGSSYRSILHSSGNRDITSTLEGDPILARVLEIQAPLVATRQAAETLKRLSRQSYGWPLHQVKAGRVTAEQMLDYQARARELLATDQERASVVEDIAVRCSVLVAGAQALGELVGFGEQMRDAALRAAQEMLGRVSAALLDSHRPLSERLLAAVREAFERRPYAFPDEIEVGNDDRPSWRELDGWRTAQTRDGIVFRGALEEIAVKARIEDPGPALRALRTEGKLKCRSGGHLTGQVKRKGRLFTDVYVFAADALWPPEAVTPVTAPKSPENTGDIGNRLQSDEDDEEPTRRLPISPVTTGDSAPVTAVTADFEQSSVHARKYKRDEPLGPASVAPSNLDPELAELARKYPDLTLEELAAAFGKEAPDEDADDDQVDNGEQPDGRQVERLEQLLAWVRDKHPNQSEAWLHDFVEGLGLVMQGQILAGDIGSHNGSDVDGQRPAAVDPELAELARRYPDLTLEELAAAFDKEAP